MNKQDEMWALEWSQRSNNLHVQPLTRALAGIRHRFHENRAAVNDYVVLHVGSRADVDAAADLARPIVAARDKQLHIAEVMLRLDPAVVEHRYFDAQGVPRVVITDAAKEAAHG